MDNFRLDLPDEVLTVVMGETKVGFRRQLGGCDKISDADEIAKANEYWSKPDFQKVFVSQFVAPAEGELFLYVNDAIAAVPFIPIQCFYKNNGGKAKITIERVPVPRPSAN